MPRALVWITERARNSATNYSVMISRLSSLSQRFHEPVKKKTEKKQYEDETAAVSDRSDSP